MEDNQPTPSTTPPPAARTAQALRELHDRARTALAAQRERMVLLESQLTHQLDTIADTLAEQIASHGGSAGHAQQSLEEVARLRTELERTRVEWTTERDAWQAERAQLVAADSDRSQSLDQRQQELEARHLTLDNRATELNHQDRELRQRQEQLNSSAAQCAAQQLQLSEAESTLDKQRADVAEREAAVQKSQTELNYGQAESTSRLASLEQQFNTERAAWDHERANVEEQRRLFAKERDDLATALEAARGELATAREHAAAAGERDELRQKFDLALEDIQRLRARVAEHEQELASRPAPAEMDPVELVHLRAERDVMAERIAELEQKSAVQENADVSQEQADLQRRFELAVEDVRDLKKKNAELEAQVAAVKSHAVPASSSAGGSSWEAMKKQMLADLADEGGTVDEDRQQDRATIENTIRITDEALTCKDREIDELKSRLAEGAHLPPAQDQEVERLVDADEVIAGHRARIANLEKETTEKLRAAELEISVERAKIARETAHLEDLKAEIGAQRASGETPGMPGGVQHPKRRWLSKLGLSGEDDEK